MNAFPFFLLFVLALLCAFQCETTHNAAAVVVPNTHTPHFKMDGLTMVAPPQKFTSNPMLPVQDIGAGWIAVIPYAYTMPGKPSVRYAENNWQWWGETPAGATETIRLAHEAGIKVMLKPQVYVPGGWTGTLDFANDAEWAQWEADYRRYILHFAHIADTTQADLFCIGTEFNNAIQKRTAYWRQLIGEIKQQYKGKLIYSSNWDDWERVPFWAEVDYIGLGGYFPLVEADTPSVEALKTAWLPIKQRLKAFSTAQQRPIVFTEFGYLTVDHCGWRNWELEQGIQQRPINEQAQANCFEALFATFYPEPWWAGGFLWKWFPNGQGHEGYPERDYTPQNKLGAKTIQKWYSSVK